ncbi:hypothetical protein [Pseudovibrio sp. WM33]|uniref:hypothetical protein n=1 Tax=Pseudovibrio sp. WM33 TaxID=1735585 RepID=UPI0007AE7953|nr:hypothetical protein [Pseudovibrio sp. WM33]KZL18131.1 hypothetical protein PsWM33_05118 [Pseudovibrio sp. WM33]
MHNQFLEVFVFTAEKGGHAITKVKDGSNLPKDLGPWKFQKTMRIGENDAPRIGADMDSKEMYQRVSEDGYILQPSDLAEQ